MLVCADARRIPLADNSVQCVVTSPPYWGLRKYAGEQELIWGGDPNCGHELDGVGGEAPELRTGLGLAKLGEKYRGGGHKWSEEQRIGGGKVEGKERWNHSGHGEHGHAATTTGTCVTCGAWRGAYGLEPTVEMYVAHTVEILREIRRVLRPDGVCFWNIGDCYQSGTRGHYMRSRVVSYKSLSYGKHQDLQGAAPNRFPQDGLKDKDLVLMPSRVALAAQADGWWVRSMIIWAKPNPMPESVTDRPTDAYEHIVMLTKSARYYWDMEAVSEPVSPNTHLRISQDVAAQIGSERVPGKTNGNMKAVVRGGVNPKAKVNPPGAGVKQNESFSSAVCLPVLKRNMRNVWAFATQPYSGAHFATFPEELPRRCILAASKVGDLILDPFGGSGTTGRVAIELRRRPILLDLAYSHDYGPLAQKRTTNVQLEAFA